MTTTQAGAVPGWYPRPEAPGMLRYWDGAGWTDHWAPAAQQPVSDGSGIAAGAIVCAFLIPILGLILALFAISKGSRGAGSLAMVLSLAMCVFYAALFTGSL